MEQEIRYCTSFDGTRIAYSTIGDKSHFPLVRVATWLTHLEYDWESPIWRPWLEELGQDFFLVRYDPRGCGLSDRDPTQVSFNTWVRDLEQVVESVGLDRFALLGLSQGGPVGIEYALEHQDRVSQLILWGAFSVGWIRRGRITEEERNALYTLTKEGWGRDSPAYRAIFTNLFIPDASDEQMNWFNELERKSMTGEEALRYLTEAGNLDVTSKLNQVSIPTLVMHARDDSLVPYEEGRILAANIPGAKLVTLESRNHILLKNETEWPKAFQGIRDFCGLPRLQVSEGDRDQRNVDSTGIQQERRKLAAVMFADMVGYTSLTQRDETVALNTLKELEVLVRPIFLQFQGREIKAMGDAFLVEFGSALEATRCALSIQSALQKRNMISTNPGQEKIALRIGIHLGDIEVRGGDILGDAVNIASRLQPLARPEGICVSQQLYDQIRNKDEFLITKIGKRQLKNVKTPLVVYDVSSPHH